ncbi:unnamed protein product, partial [Mesorhabditis spiculigera]
MILILILLIPLTWGQDLCDFDRHPCPFVVDDPWFVTDRIYIPNVFNGPPAQLFRNSRFVAAQGRFGGVSQGNVTGSGWSSTDGRPRRIRFLFAKSTHSTKINIILDSEDGTSRCIDSVIGVGLLQWNPRTVVVPPGEGAGRIVFQVSGIQNSFDVVALDDIRFDRVVRDALHPKLAFSLDRSSSGYWTAGRGRAVIGGKRVATLSSPSILIPQNGHLQIDILSSESSQISILTTTGLDEELIWVQDGKFAGPGWNSVRIPLRVTPLPVRVLIRVKTSPSGRLAVTNTRLVDAGGKELGCEESAPAIRPMRSETIQRLTALQQLDELPPLPLFASLPISPSIVNMNSPAFALPTPAMPIFMTPSPQPLRDPRQSDYLRQIGATPAMRDQLKQLAKRFGIDDLSGVEAERALATARRLFGDRLGGLGLATNALGAQTRVGMSPITPLVSRQESPFKPLPSTASLNSELVRNLASVITLPAVERDPEQRPMARKNVDFIVQNAFQRLVDDQRQMPEF